MWLRQEIKGKVSDAFQASDAGSPLLAQAEQPPPLAEASSSAKAGESVESDGGEKDRDTTIHVVYVSDIDVLSGQFVYLRANPNDQDIPWQFENVPFALNVVGSLVGEDELVRVRKRKTRHSTLKMVNFQDRRCSGSCQRTEGRVSTEVPRVTRCGSKAE